MTMTTRETFDFITDVSLDDAMIDEYLNKAQDKVETRGELDAEAEIQDNVFKQTWIPRTMLQVDFEEYFDELEYGYGDMPEIYHRAVLGINKDLSGAAEVRCRYDIQPKLRN
jgi:hypothetical protein